MGIKSSILPYVTVIIPAYNEETSIGHCLAGLTHQTYPFDRYEILVIDNGSTDGTRRQAEKYPVKLIAEANPQNAYSARNRGIREARGSIIAFTDSDISVDKVLSA